MAQKKTRRKHDMPKFNCNKVETPKFYIKPPEPMIIQSSFQDILCCPLTTIGRIYDFCSATLAGVHYCLLCWLVIHCISSKWTRYTTPDPVFCPYYFFLMSQILVVSVFFLLIWVWCGEYFILYFRAAIDACSPEPNATKSVLQDGTNLTKMVYRKFCFVKSDLFEEPMTKTEASCESRKSDSIGLLILELIVYSVFDQ